MKLYLSGLCALALSASFMLTPNAAVADSCVPEEDQACMPTIDVTAPTPPYGGGGGVVGIGGGNGCAGCSGGGNTGGGWTPTYNDTYTDAHSCAMSPEDRQRMAADAVRVDALQEQGTRGQVGARRLTIQGYGGSQEQFDIVPGNYGGYGGFALVYGIDFVSLVPGSCQPGTSGT